MSEQEKVTWGDKEQEIIDAIKAHRDWFTENYDLVRSAIVENFGEQAGHRIEEIEGYINGAEATVERYLELGEDREGNISGHLRYNAFGFTNNFRVSIGHGLGIKAVFELPKW